MRPLVGASAFISFSALTLLVEWQKRHPAHEETCAIYFQRYSSEARGGRNSWGNQLINNHLENCH